MYDNEITFSGEQARQLRMVLSQLRFSGGLTPLSSLETASDVIGWLGSFGDKLGRDTDRLIAKAEELDSITSDLAAVGRLLARVGK